MLFGGWQMSAVGRPSTKPEVVGPYPEFARLVLQITGDVPRSTAAVRAGISHDTIARMWRGEKVSPDAIARFAAGYKVDPAPLLRAGGHGHLVTQSSPDTKEPEADVPKIERISVFPTPEGYQDLDDPIVQAADAGAREAAQQAYRTTFKSIADALRYARKIAPGTVMGPAPEDDE